MKKASPRVPTLLFVLFLTACSGEAQVLPAATHTPRPLATEPVSTPTPIPTDVRLNDDTEHQFPGRLTLDSIAPIYNPVFAPAEETLIEETDLVMGVAIDGQAKAYPVNVLRFREMVNDELAGWPILVSW